MLIDQMYSVQFLIVYFLNLENSQPASHLFPWPLAVNVTLNLSNSRAFCPNCNNFDNL